MATVAYIESCGIVLSEKTRGVYEMNTPETQNRDMILGALGTNSNVQQVLRNACNAIPEQWHLVSAMSEDDWSEDTLHSLLPHWHQRFLTWLIHEPNTFVDRMRDAYRFFVAVTLISVILAALTAPYSAALSTWVYGNTYFQWALPIIATVELLNVIYGDRQIRWLLHNARYWKREEWYWQRGRPQLPSGYHMDASGARNGHRKLGIIECTVPRVEYIVEPGSIFLLFIQDDQPFHA